MKLIEGNNSAVSVSRTNTTISNNNDLLTNHQPINIAEMFAVCQHWYNAHY